MDQSGSGRGSQSFEAIEDESQLVSAAQAARERLAAAGIRTFLDEEEAEES